MRCTSVTKAVLLVGTSLLSLNAAAWRVDLDFNDGAVGSRAQGSGGFSDAAGQSYYTTAQSYEGGKAVELNVTAGDTAFGSWGGIINHPSNLVKGDEIWFRVRTFMPAGFNYNSSGEGGHLKFLRVHTLPAGSPDGNQGYDDWYINPAGSSISHKFIFEGEQVWSQFASSAYAPVLGVWETYEMYLYLDNVPVSAGGKGRVRIVEKRRADEGHHRPENPVLGHFPVRPQPPVYLLEWRGSKDAEDVRG